MSHIRSRLTLVLALVVGLAGLLCLTGCEYDELVRQRAEDTKEHVEPIRVKLSDRKAELEDSIAEPGIPPEQLDAWQAELETVTVQLAVAEKALAAADRVIADPQGGLVNEVVGFVAPFVPEPYRLPLVLGGGLIVTVLRAIQTRRAARDIAKGVQVAIEADPDLKAKFQAQAGRISAQQGHMAKRLVDEAQGKAKPKLL